MYVYVYVYVHMHVKCGQREPRGPMRRGGTMIFLMLVEGNERRAVLSALFKLMPAHPQGHPSFIIDDIILPRGSVKQAQNFVIVFFGPSFQSWQQFFFFF